MSGNAVAAFAAPPKKKNKIESADCPFDRRLERFQSYFRHDSKEKESCTTLADEQSLSIP